MDAAELEWIAWTNPITTAFGAEVAASDLSGRTVACHQHILPESICIVGPLLEAGARIRMAPCNPDSTDDRTAAHLASMGVDIRGHAGMSAVEHADALAWLASEPADALCGRTRFSDWSAGVSSLAFPGSSSCSRSRDASFRAR